MITLLFRQLKEELLQNRKNTQQTDIATYKQNRPRLRGRFSVFCMITTCYGLPNVCTSVRVNSFFFVYMCVALSLSVLLCVYKCVCSCPYLLLYLFKCISLSKSALVCVYKCVFLCLCLQCYWFTSVYSSVYIYSAISFHVLFVCHVLSVMCLLYVSAQ